MNEFINENISMIIYFRLFKVSLKRSTSFFKVVKNFLSRVIRFAIKSETAGLPETKTGNTCWPTVVRISAIFRIVWGSGRPGMVGNSGKPGIAAALELFSATIRTASLEVSAERLLRLRDSLESSTVSSEEESSSSSDSLAGSSCSQIEKKNNISSLHLKNV